MYRVTRRRCMTASLRHRTLCRAVDAVRLRLSAPVPALSWDPFDVVAPLSDWTPALACMLDTLVGDDLDDVTDEILRGAA